jgi:glyoxylase-like metal-dependent hydrolase (beta-lactamase superfamily II)
VVSQLALLGLGPSDIRYVVNSHFHFDHCGGNEFFPHSTFLVQRPEMEAARQVLAGVHIRYSPSPIDFDLALDYALVDGEHDVFGDGQLILLPTYGHTPGHQSVLVRAGKDTQLVLTADACYTLENMDRDVLPNVLWDPQEMSRSLARLRDLRDREGATVIYGHDAGQWEELRRAPAPLL